MSGGESPQSTAARCSSKNMTTAEQIALNISDSVDRFLAGDLEEDTERYWDAARRLGLEREVSNILTAWSLAEMEKAIQALQAD